jgi:hypothetical protein
MGTQNRRRGTPQRSPAEIAQLVAEYQTSGLTATAFCREKRMNRMTLQAYQLRQQKAVWERAAGKGRRTAEISADATEEAGPVRYGSRAETYRLMAEYEKSGLTREEFCRRSGVSVKTLTGQLARYRRRKGEDPSPRWVAVEVAGAGRADGKLALVLGSGRRIEIERGFDGETLHRLISQLERE